MNHSFSPQFPVASPMPLENAAFLSALSLEERAHFIAMGTPVVLESGIEFIREGEPANDFYLILSGEVDVLKQVNGTTRQYRIASLLPSHMAGEMALLPQHIRTATLRTTLATKMLKFNVADLKNEGALYTKLVLQLSQALSVRLQETNEISVNAIQNKLEEEIKRNVLASLTIVLLAVVSVYSFALDYIRKLGVWLGNTTLISDPLILLLSLITFQIIHRTRLPWATFGLTRVEWKKKTIEAVFFSLPLLLMILLLKALWIKWHHLHTPLIGGYHVYRFHGQVSLHFYLIALISYILLCPFQEFIARAGLQNTLYLFIPGSERMRLWTAIALSNIVFILSHLHISMFFSLLILPFGLFWGWLFARQRCLISVSVSHILIGVWAEFVVGVSYLFR